MFLIKKQKFVTGVKNAWNEMNQVVSNLIDQNEIQIETVQASQRNNKRIIVDPKYI